MKRMVSIHDTFVDASATFSIPVAFAAVMRIKQHAPFYELYLIRELIYMQYSSLMCVVFVTLSTLSELGPYHKGSKRVLIIVLYGALEFGLFWGQIGSLVNNDQRWESSTAKELINACRINNQHYPVRVMSTKVNFRHLLYSHGIVLFILPKIRHQNILPE
jgi:hypothetical protein